MSEYKLDVGTNHYFKIIQEYFCCKYNYAHILRYSNYYQAKRVLFEKHEVMTPAHQV